MREITACKEIEDMDTNGSPTAVEIRRGLAPKTPTGDRADVYNRAWEDFAHFAGVHQEVNKENANETSNATTTRTRTTKRFLPSFSCLFPD